MDSLYGWYVTVRCLSHLICRVLAKLSMKNYAVVSVCAWCTHQLDRILRIASFTEVGCKCLLLYADLWLCWLPGHHGWLGHPLIGNQTIWSLIGLKWYLACMYLIDRKTFLIEMVGCSNSRHPMWQNQVWPVLLINTTLYVTSRGGGVTLYYNYTPCAFLLKIIDPLLRTACTESHPPIADSYNIFPPPIAEQGIPFFRHTKMFKDRRAISQYWFLERCCRGWARRTLEPRIHIKNCLNIPPPSKD
jgi:hypothetical protein